MYINLMHTQATKSRLFLYLFLGREEGGSEKGHKFMFRVKFRLKEGEKKKNGQKWVLL